MVSPPLAPISGRMGEAGDGARGTFARGRAGGGPRGVRQGAARQRIGMGPPSKGFAKELTPALTKRDVSKRAGTWTRNSTKGGDPYAYSRVWSKEAYGGEYHVARSMDGADAMVENAKEVELGYEKPVGGLTTNFVGNHMTQGAIDLVQAELNRPDPYYEARALGAAASQQQQYALPQRVDGDGAGAGAPLPEAVIAPEAFTWVDMCSRVVVIVPEPRAAGAGFELLCADFSMRACKVEWRTAGNKLVRFQVRDAYGALDAASCSAAPKAAAAEDGGEVIITLAKLGGGMRSAGGVCGADCADGSEGVIGSASPRGADTSTSRVWKALERPSAIVAVPASRRGGVSKPTVDARALRRSLKAARAARKSTGVRPAADGSDAAVAEAMAEAAKIAAGSTTPLLPCTGGDKTGEAPGADEGEVPKGYSVESAKAEGNKMFSLVRQRARVSTFLMPTLMLTCAACDADNGTCPCQSARLLPPLQMRHSREITTVPCAATHGLCGSVTSTTSHSALWAPTMPPARPMRATGLQHCAARFSSTAPLRWHNSAHSMP